MYSKDVLFALMVTKKPVRMVDRITGRECFGVIKNFHSEPGHEKNMIVKIGNQVIYTTEES